MKDKINFSKHSEYRAKERNIDKEFLLKAIRYPDKIDISNKNSKRFVIKKIYYNNSLKKDHLLMAVCEKNNNVLHVITIIDTSKITKYF